MFLASGPIACCSTRMLTSLQLVVGGGSGETCDLSFYVMISAKVTHLQYPFRSSLWWTALQTSFGLRWCSALVRAP
jgi:hypothetical protein